MRIPARLIRSALALASAIGLPTSVVVSRPAAVAGTAIVGAGSVADCPKYAKSRMSMNHREPILLAG
jgi:hypothetical protein